MSSLGWDWPTSVNILEQWWSVTELHLTQAAYHSHATQELPYKLTYLKMSNDREGGVGGSSAESISSVWCGNLEVLFAMK